MYSDYIVGLSRDVRLTVVVLMEIPCRRGSLRTNLHKSFPQTLDLNRTVPVLGPQSPRKLSRTPLNSLLCMTVKSINSITATVHEVTVKKKNGLLLTGMLKSLSFSLDNITGIVVMPSKRS